MRTEGRIDIRLAVARHRVSGVTIHSSRPLGISRVFVGKSPEELLKQMPLLYSVCGVAQSTAAWRACQQALGEPESGLLARAHDVLVGCETLREHWMRIQLGWPALLDTASSAEGLQVPVRLLARARRFLFSNGEPFCLNPSLQIGGDALSSQLSILSDVLEDAVFAIAPAQWYAFSSKADLDAWIDHVDNSRAEFLRFLRDNNDAGWDMAEADGMNVSAATFLRCLRDNDESALGGGETAFLPDLSADELNRRLAEKGAGAFIARPRWHQSPCETGPLTRQWQHPLIQALQADYGRGLMTRAVARLLELAQLPEVLSGQMQGLQQRVDAGRDSAGLPPGVGIGQVETARGRLVHRLLLDGTQVAQYQILAPTEWNFHPQGPLATGLMHLGEGDVSTLRRRAAILIEAIDPCVAWTLEIGDA
jgi:hypothetical protein